MNTEWKLVPVELQAAQIRKLQIGTELGAYAASNLSGAYSMFEEFWKVAVDSAPVPPAGGEVEVLGHLVDDGAAKSFHIAFPHWAAGYAVTELVDRAHVTRLQAEVQTYRSFEGVWQMALDLLPERFRSAGGLVPGLQDLIAERDDIVERYGKMQTGEEKMLNRVIDERDALKTEVGFLMKRASKLKTERDALQSELTKARELSEERRELLDLVRDEDGINYTNKLKARIASALARQSAPAAKGEGDE